MTIQRITVLAVITLSCVFAVTASTHAVSDWDWGSDNWYPANGYAYVSLHPAPGQVQTYHTVWCYNYSFNDDLTCFYSFEAQIWEKPTLRDERKGSFKAPHKDRNGRTQGRTHGGALSIGIGSLAKGRYTLDAYTRLNADAIQIKAKKVVIFEVN